MPRVESHTSTVGNRGQLQTTGEDGKVVLALAPAARGHPRLTADVRSTRLENGPSQAPVVVRTAARQPQRVGGGARLEAADTRQHLAAERGGIPNAPFGDRHGGWHVATGEGGTSSRMSPATGGAAG